MKLEDNKRFNEIKDYVCDLNNHEVYEVIMNLLHRDVFFLIDKIEELKDKNSRLRQLVSERDKQIEELSKVSE